MLSGNKRVAVKRIPSHELVYSSKFVGECQLQGKHCGKLQTLYLTVSERICTQVEPFYKDTPEIGYLYNQARVHILLLDLYAKLYP